MLEFGRTVQPLLEKFAQTLKWASVDPACDTQCVVDKCININRPEPDFNCFANTCKCKMQVTPT